MAGDVHPVAVVHLGGQVELVDVGVACGPPGGGEDVGHPGAAGHDVDTGAGDGSGGVHGEACRRVGPARGGCRWHRLGLGKGEGGRRRLAPPAQQRGDEEGRDHGHAHARGHGNEDRCRGETGRQGRPPPLQAIGPRPGPIRSGLGVGRRVGHGLLPGRVGVDGEARAAPVTAGGTGEGTGSREPTSGPRLRAARSLRQRVRGVWPPRPGQPRPPRRSPRPWPRRRRPRPARPRPRGG